MLRLIESSNPHGVTKCNRARRADEVGEWVRPDSRTVGYQAPGYRARYACPSGVSRGLPVSGTDPTPLVSR